MTQNVAACVDIFGKSFVLTFKQDGTKLIEEYDAKSDDYTLAKHLTSAERIAIEAVADWATEVSNGA